MKVKCLDCKIDETASYVQGFHIGRALLEYASNALDSKNTNFTILFSGMAIDCYLSHLYFKWRDIEELQKAVITGSFNFSKAAEDENAENLIIIRDRELAERYLENWNVHGGIQGIILHDRLRRLWPHSSL